MASITERGGRWWVRWREDGRDRSKTVSSKRAAERLASKVEDALERDGRFEPGRVRSATPLADAFRDYLTDCSRRNAKATTYKYARILEGFRRWMGPVTVASLSYSALSEYQGHLQTHGRHGHPRKETSVKKHFVTIELAWRYAWQQQGRGVFKGVPQPDTLSLKSPPAPRRPAPTWEQMDAMVAAAGGWQRDLYVVLRCTGLRVQQAMGMDWSDVDLALGQLHVRPDLGKSRAEKRGRWVPLAPALVAELAGWGQRTGPVIRCGREQRVARPRDASRAWERAGVDPKIWKGSPHHAFRRGFKSGLARLGVSKEVRDYLVGHVGGIDEHYLDPAALGLTAAVGLIPPLPGSVRNVYKLARGTEK